MESWVKLIEEGIEFSTSLSTEIMFYKKRGIYYACVSMILRIFLLLYFLVWQQMFVCINKKKKYITGVFA